jgi:hypothetical protein
VTGDGDGSSDSGDARDGVAVMTAEPLSAASWAKISYRLSVHKPVDGLCKNGTTPVATPGNAGDSGANPGS